MKYKVGDKVRIKSKEILKNTPNTVSDMLEYAGKEAFISRVIGDNSYEIDADNSEWSWTDDMFEEPAEPTLFDRIKSAIIEAGKQAPVIIEQTEDGGVKISPIDTPSFKAAMTCKEIGEEWTLGLYTPNKEQDWSKVGIKYVIPFEVFNPYNIEESLKHNIVK